MLPVRPHLFFSSKNMPNTPMIGRCTRIDQNGNRCAFTNNSSNAFNSHDNRHDEPIEKYACFEKRCHMVFNAFEHAYPKLQFDRHMKSHQDESILKMQGSTKISRLFLCDKQNTANGKLCGYSFEVERNLKCHQRQHVKIWKCGEKEGNEACANSYSAFTNRFPQGELIRHQSSNHNIQSVVCPDCLVWFRDMSYGGILFLCDDRLELHRIDGRCFNYAAPVNYLWLDWPAQEQPFEDLDDQLIVYSGRSYDGWSRPFDQISVLHTNYSKSKKNRTRIDKDATMYEQTVVLGSGLYLMGLNQQNITDKESYEAACKLVTSFESTSKCTIFKLLFSFSLYPSVTCL